MSIEQRIYNGNRAKEVLENEAFLAAFQDIEAEITDQWKQTPVRDAEGREKLWLMLQMLNKVRLTITATMETGKLAELELRHQKTMQERAKEWLGLNSED